MAKLAKAQMGKIMKSVGKSIIKKRPTEQVFGAAATIGSAGAFTAAALLAKQRREFEERQKSSEVVAKRKKNAEILKQDYTSKKQKGGAVKTKTKK